MRFLAAFLAAAAFAKPAPSTGHVAVFSDQLPDGLSPGLVRFAAAHYAGAQKLGLSETKALKRLNPAFFMLQYRLGLGLGRHTSLRYGDAWLPEWPRRTRERWFFHRSGHREFMHDWGWYLMNPDDASWRGWYAAQLRRQLVTTDADGAFLDSVSVPNEFGGSAFSPALRDYDPPFERAWSARIERFLPWIRSALGRPVVVNAGSWVTTRDRTDYSAADGVMVEGFALGLAESDWELELGRALGLVARDKIVIAQAYPDAGDVRARMFALASYLLIEGDHTYLNFGEGIGVNWFPEYDVRLGAPVDPPGLRRDGGAFVRRFAAGLVLANPGDVSVSVDVGAGYAAVTPHGGGEVPESGVEPVSWRLTEQPVAGAVTLGAREGALLLRLH